jgi:mRNA interferase HigB
MRIIARRTLRSFWEKHVGAEQPLRAWFKFASSADWNSPASIKWDYSSASILEDGRVCFNIGGNKYRLVVWINYAYRIIYIRFVGTHAEYDKVDVTKI